MSRRVVLASASPARRRLLEAGGVVIEQQPAAVDEDEIKRALRAEGTPPGDAATVLAELKAHHVDRQFAGDPEPPLVLGADQILTADGRWFDKPADRAGARAQLEQLQGRRHELWTAAVVVRGGERIWHTVREAQLWMRPLSDAFLDHYLDAAGDLVVSSVGAYHIEGLGAQLFSRIQGDLFTVQGLPLLDVLAFLRQQQVLPA